MPPVVSNSLFYAVFYRELVMQVKPDTTVAELMARFPNGFSVGPGTPEDPGTLSRIVFASSHFVALAKSHSVAEGNRGYLVVDMDEDASA